MPFFAHNNADKMKSGAVKPLSFMSSILKKWFNRSEFFTIMVIPHAPVKNVKSLKFSRWIVTSFAIINFLMFSVVCAFGISYHILNKKLENKKAEYETLLTMKDQSEQQLNEYKASENEIKDKIKVLKDLETKLRGIIESTNSEPQAGTGESFKIASRGMGGGLSSYVDPYSEVDNLDGIGDISRTIDEMALQVDDEIKELDAAILKAENKIKEMRAKPTVLPTYGRITSTFGNRKNPFGRGYENHEAIDIANSKGTPIKASADGVVTFAGRDGGYGNLVKINHGNGYESLYGHNSKLAVKVGQRVERGDLIAYMGSTGRSTGSHCHFEVRYKGKPVNPYTIK